MLNIPPFFISITQLTVHKWLVPYLKDFWSWMEWTHM